MAESIANFRIHYHGAVPADVDLSQRLFNELRRHAWEKVGYYWHANFRPKHFTREGAREYGYQPRAGEPGRPKKNFWRSYAGWKQKHLGHQLPLVLTGELREATRVFRVVATSTATSSRLRVILPAAAKANFRHPKSPIDMRAELTHVSEAEAAELVQYMDAVMDDWLRDFRHESSKTSTST
jgi:hypothetical protein